jgi:hypothetical protein
MLLTPPPPCRLRPAATAAAAAAAATAVAVAVTDAIPVAIAVAVAVAVVVALPSPLLSPSWLPKECAIHAAMERLLNGSCIGVNVATGPRGATDLNAIEEHRAKAIVFHPDKSSHENTAVEQGRTIGGRAVTMMWFAMLWTKNSHTLETYECTFYLLHL